MAATSRTIARATYFVLIGQLGSALYGAVTRAGFRGSNVASRDEMRCDAMIKYERSLRWRYLSGINDVHITVEFVHARYFFFRTKTLGLHYLFITTSRV